MKQVVEQGRSVSEVADGLGVTLLSSPFRVLESLCGRGASVMVHGRPR